MHFLRFSRRDVLKQTINYYVQTDKKKKLAVVNFKDNVCYNVAHDFMANFTWYDSYVTAGVFPRTTGLK